MLTHFLSKIILAHKSFSSINDISTIIVEKVKFEKNGYHSIQASLFVSRVIRNPKIFVIYFLH